MNKKILQQTLVLALLSLNQLLALAQVAPASPPSAAARESLAPGNAPSGNTAVGNDPRYIIVSNNQTAYAVISKREMSRIAVQGGRIRYADLREESAEVYRADGELRILPVANDSRPVNLLITTAGGSTFTLVLEQKELPSQTVILIDKNPQKVSKSTSEGVRVLRSNEHQRNVRSLLLAMARNSQANDLEVSEVNTEFVLWKESHFVLRKRYDGRELTGLVFELTNVSQAPMRLVEQEFFKTGVYAVSILKHQLQPQEQTFIYVVAERKDE